MINIPKELLENLSFTIGTTLFFSGASIENIEQIINDMLATFELFNSESETYQLIKNNIEKGYFSSISFNTSKSNLH